MMLLTALLVQAVPAPLPPDASRLCLRREVMRLASNTDTAEANADTALAACESELAAFITALNDRFRTDRRTQMRMLRDGKPLPDMRAGITQAVHGATRANAIEATKRLRAGKSIEGIRSTGKGGVVVPNAPSDAAATPTPKP